MPNRMLKDDRKIGVRLVVAPLTSLLLCPFFFGGTTDQSPSETPQGQRRSSSRRANEPWKPGVVLADSNIRRAPGYDADRSRNFPCRRAG